MTRPANFALAADIVVITDEQPTPSILLIERRNNPYAGSWALPGGYIEIDEDLHIGAARELEEETGILAPSLTQIGAFGKPDRDPRGRVVSVAFLAKIPVARKNEAKAADDARQAEWFSLDTLPPLAFDHSDIIAQALTLIPTIGTHRSVE